VVYQRERGKRKRKNDQRGKEKASRCGRTREKRKLALDLAKDNGTGQRPRVGSSSGKKGKNSPGDENINANQKENIPDNCTEAKKRTSVGLPEKREIRRGGEIHSREEPSGFTLLGVRKEAKALPLQEESALKKNAPRRAFGGSHKGNPAMSLESGIP